MARCHAAQVLQLGEALRKADAARQTDVLNGLGVVTSPQYQVESYLAKG